MKTIAAVALVTLAALQVTPANAASCLDDVANFAIRICGDIATSGTSTVVDANGNIDANISNIIERVVGGASTAINGHVLYDTYVGVARDQLAGVHFSDIDCRQKMVNVAVAQVCPTLQSPSRTDLTQILVYGPTVRITSGGSSQNAGCVKRVVQSCAYPEHGGRLLPASGKLVDVSSSGQVGSSVVVDSPDQICIQLWALPTTCEAEVSIQGRAVATEEYATSEKTRAVTPSGSTVNTPPVRRGDGNAWLTILGVRTWDGALLRTGVRVLFKVNGVNYTYPSFDNVKWQAFGYDQSTAPQSFRIPVSDQYTVNFRAEFQNGVKWINAEDQHAKADQTEVYTFQFHGYADRTRGSVDEGELSYTIRTTPP
jgi:hypothetical protein